jgi:hypothetical protein
MARTPRKATLIMQLSTKTKQARSRGPILSHWMRGVANGGAISSHPRRRERSPHVPAKKRGGGDFAIAKRRTSSRVSFCLLRDGNMPQILLLSRLSYLASSGYVSLSPAFPSPVFQTRKTTSPFVCLVSQPFTISLDIPLLDRSICLVHCGHCEDLNIL